MSDWAAIEAIADTRTEDQLRAVLARLNPWWSESQVALQQRALLRWLHGRGPCPYRIPEGQTEGAFRALIAARHSPTR